MRQLFVGGCLILLLNGCTAVDPAESTMASSASSSSSVALQTTEPSRSRELSDSTTTSSAVPLTTTTIVHFVDGVADIDFRDDIGVGGLHPAGFSGPVTGWVSTVSPASVSVGIDGNGDQLVKIGDSTSVANEQGRWIATGMVHLDPGINEVLITIRNLSPPLDIAVPITYLAGATVRLATVIEADENSITLDFGYYYWSGSFGLPGDNDPGVLETFPVAPNAYVILNSELVAECWWFIEQRQDGTVRDDIGWDPTVEFTYYWATIHEQQLVELWRVPFG